MRILKPHMKSRKTMPRLYNTVTKKFLFAPDSYKGKFPFETVEEAAAKGIIDTEAPVEEPKPAAKPKKKKAGYKADAIDGDGDGLVQDGTVFQRPVGEELTEEQIAALDDSAENEVAE